MLAFSPFVCFDLFFSGCWHSALSQIFFAHNFIIIIHPPFILAATEAVKVNWLSFAWEGHSPKKLACCFALYNWSHFDHHFRDWLSEYLGSFLCVWLSECFGSFLFIFIFLGRWGVVGCFCFSSIVYIEPSLKLLTHCMRICLCLCFAFCVLELSSFSWIVLVNQVVPVWQYMPTLDTPA